MHTHLRHPWNLALGATMVACACAWAFSAAVPKTHAQTSATSASTTLTGTVLSSTSSSTNATSSTSTGTVTGTVSTTPSTTTPPSNETGTVTGTVGTTTSTTTTPNDLNALIAQLQGLKTTFPNFAGWLQSFIDQLLGMGTSSNPGGNQGTSGAAMIDQNGKVARAGDQIDFGGHNFGHEEQVLVTLNGAQVATAHADGGGNFSTGSVRLPSTPGAYTYVFAGQGAGDTAQATVTVK